MRSLFLKIFLSFWAAQALFLVLAILVVIALRPTREPGIESIVARAATESVAAYRGLPRWALTICRAAYPVSRPSARIAAAAGGKYHGPGRSTRQGPSRPDRGLRRTSVAPSPPISTTR